jgi:hypothetical protein
VRYGLWSRTAFAVDKEAGSTQEDATVATRKRDVGGAKCVACLRSPLPIGDKYALR